MFNLSLPEVAKNKIRKNWQISCSETLYVGTHVLFQKWMNSFGRKIPKDQIQVQKEGEYFVVACLSPP